MIPREITIKVTEDWQRDALESFFGDEDVSNIRTETEEREDGKDKETEYEMELTLRRTRPCSSDS